MKQRRKPSKRLIWEMAKVFLSSVGLSILTVHFSGICPPDAITFDYVQQRTDAPFEAVHADAGASYVEEYRFDVSKIEPLVAAPHSPDNRKKAAECSNVSIDRVYIGCVCGVAA